MEAMRWASSRGDEAAAGGRRAEKGVERGVVGVRTPVEARKLAGALCVANEQLHQFRGS